jgi:asparagine synthase (glutamine-hydrolysing)
LIGKFSSLFKILHILNKDKIFMCAIFGFLADIEQPGNILDQMSSALLHRGPDDQGKYIEGRLGLGHNRLSIIDLSPAGHQPMVLEQDGLVLVFNGEIFNYRELRQELSGESFFSETDTEVLLRGFKVWGKECLHRINGMFAFAIWDRNKKELFLARDRFGIKPLYYTRKSAGFYFASEPKGLFAAGVKRRDNLMAWSTYLSFGTYEHAEYTFFDDVCQLRAGHSATVSSDGKIQIETYYDFAKIMESSVNEKIEDENRISDEYLSTLSNAVDICFRSDVPVGLAVSGGVDSSILVAMVRESGRDSNKVKAFTYACGDDRYDETPWVRKLLAQQAHPWHISETKNGLIPDLIMQVSLNQEEPFGGINTLCFSELCRLAQNEKVKVLLDGNGLDEQWGGYEYYSRTDWTTEEFVRGPVQSSKSASVRPSCLALEFKEKAEILDFPRPFASMIDNLRYRDLFYTKIPRALRFSDRASMMCSRELRIPFLDHRLVEYSFKVAPSNLISNGQHKYLLRRMVKALIPECILNAPKRPLHTPQREWLANELSGFVDDIIHSRKFRELGWFDLKVVDKEWEKFKNSEVDNSFFVWQWISAALMTD